MRTLILRRLNIRWRLTFWFGLAMTLLLVVRSFWIYDMMNVRLNNRTDVELDRKMDVLEAAVQAAETKTELQRVLQEHSGSKRVWQIKAAGESHGAPFEMIGRAPQKPVQSKRPSPRPGRTYATTEVDGRTLRVVSAPVSTPFGLLTLSVGRSMQAQVDEARDFIMILLTTLPLVIVAAVGVGYFVSSRALRPVALMTATASDITAKRLDHHIAVPDTGDELAQLAQTFNEMLDRLHQSFDEMRRFTADAAHDLRTPVAALRSEIEVGLMTNKTVEDYRESMQVILSEAVHLGRLSDHLLDLCREDHGIHPDHNERVALDKVIADVVDDMQVPAGQKRIDIRVDLPGRCTISGDSLRIRRVFTNLLHNAIQYTEPGGHIWVRGKFADRQMRIEVADDGPGIPSADLPHIFERFRRVDKSRNREKGGAGLGLSICKAIVESHGGQIDVQSSPGNGTSITVTFPVAVEKRIEPDPLEGRFM